MHCSDMSAYVLENRLWARAVLETDRISDLLSELHIHLVSDTLSNTHGGHTTRLRASNKFPVATTRCVLLSHPLRDLCRLARTGLCVVWQQIIAVSLQAAIVIGLSAIMSEQTRSVSVWARMTINQQHLVLPQMMSRF